MGDVTHRSRTMFRNPARNRWDGAPASTARLSQRATVDFLDRIDRCGPFMHKHIWREVVSVFTTEIGKGKGWGRGGLLRLSGGRFGCDAAGNISSLSASEDKVRWQWGTD
eukprot:96167-Amorphochlora_amoeboformis.AAC.1